jgi:hypothetical protein
MCWRAQTGFNWRTDHSAPWIFPDEVEVPCEETEEFVVALCPIKVAGRVDVLIGTEITLDQLTLEHTCPPSVSPISIAAPVVKDTTWYEQTITLDYDRDDAIFTIPIQLDPVNIMVQDTLGGTLGAFDTLYVGDRYTIGWDGIDLSLQTCCSDDSLTIFFRDVEYADPDSTCAGGIVDQLPGSTASYDWRIPATTCLLSGDEFRIFIEFYCADNGKKTLFRAWSESLIFSE